LPLELIDLHGSRSSGSHATSDVWIRDAREPKNAARHLIDRPNTASFVGADAPSWPRLAPAPGMREARNEGRLKHFSLQFDSYVKCFTK
jgi:hypothetical protein